MGTRGRPLRFLAVVLGAWTALRVAILWPAPLAGAAAPTTPPVRLIAPVASPLRPARGDLPSSVVEDADGTIAAAPAPGDVMQPRPLSTSSAGVDPPPQMITAVRATDQVDQPSGPPPALSGSAADRAPTPSLAAAAIPAERSPSRLHGDAYLVARGGNEGSLAFGQLGASQAGARLTYILDRNNRLALSARVATPLHDTGREAAAGVDWQPTRLPVHLLVEDRYDLDQHRNEPAAELIAGVYHAAPLGLTLDAYAQAGGVARRGPFADGAARLFHRVGLTHHLRLELGAGGWGGAQRGAARLDLGPTASLALAGHGRQGVRAGVDYRVRVAGAASPGSGPALTLGAGF